MKNAECHFILLHECVTNVEVFKGSANFTPYVYSQVVNP